jgi:hypothetical protein
MQKFEQYFVAIWCLTMPVTSFILIPSVQGTTIAYLFAFASIGFVLLKISHGELPQQVAGYFKTFAIFIGLWLLLLCGSQIGNALNPHLNIQPMFTISDENTNMFRSSLFTQSLYLLACVMIALYFRYFVPEAWMKYVYWGAWLLTIYGLYDWLFYLVFHESGDFLANRTFQGGDHPGSWSQTLNFGGLNLLRLKSTLGEPSFFSVVVIPYLFMAIEGKRKALAALLFISAILSTSTTVFIGLAICIFIETIWSEKSRTTGVIILLLLVLSFVSVAIFFPDMYRFLFEDKISGDTASGKDRMDNILLYKQLFSTFGPINWVFGMGFGYLYFSLLWSLTANTGLLGVGSFLYAFLKPAYLLPRSNRSAWLKISMISIVVVVAITLSELFIPTTWMFLGLAYRRLDQLKRERDLSMTQARRAQSAAALNPALSSKLTAG